MNNNKIIHIVAGWVVFMLSFIVFIITVSRNINFWDSAGMITTSFGFQPGQPPGSPFYLILGRIFSLFSFNPENISFSINMLSVFSASFTILFLYHIIQKISLKIFNCELSELERSHIILSIGASALGALSLAFSTSFWYSAIVAGNNSLSLLGITVCIWIALKYTEEKNKKNRSKWILLSSVLIGILISIDQYNLLVIPVIVFIFYFHTYKLCIKNILKAIMLSLLILVFIYCSIYFIPVVAAFFELLFVNSFELDYNSGLYFFAFILLISLIIGIYISGIKQKRNLNILITCFLLFITGYSSYTIILIRSAANPTIDNYNPENIFNFKTYIDKSQFGEYPLWYGHQYNSTLNKNNPYVKGESIYDTLNNKYSVVANNPLPNYKKSDKRLLPRMWSNLPDHIAAYQEWTGYRSDKVPPFSVNFNFMLRYQIAHNYFRYFMWNFTGRQNDITSHGGSLNGNWISGINFIDNLRLNNVNNHLPPGLSDNKARNTYFFLPLILGITGLIFLYKTNKKYFTITLLLFLSSGLFITFFINQHPYQPRETDYLFLGSYLTFCIWIGLSVIGIYNYMKKYLNSRYLIPVILLFIFICVPLQFFAKNYDDHNYRNNDLAYYLSYNILNSCEKDAILFSLSENETSRLEYMQEVLNIRTDIRIINLNFLNNDWYIDQIQRKQRSDGIIINAERSKYISGQREVLLINEAPSAFAEDIYYENVREINEDYLFIFNSLIEMLQQNGFDKNNPDEFKNFKEFYSKIQPHGANQSFRDFVTIVTSLNDEVYREEFGLSESQANDINQKLQRFLLKQQQYSIPLNPVLNFVFADDFETKIETKLYDYPIDYFPAQKLMMRINKTQVIDNFNLPEDEQRYILPRIEWSLNRETLTKSDLMVLEIILANMWQRPVYFSSTMNSRYFLGLDDFLYLEGLAYRLIPIKTEIANNDPVNLNTINMFRNLTEKFDWGPMMQKNIYYDDNARITLTNVRNHYSYLASSLYFEGKLDESEIILDLITRLLPDSILPYDYYTTNIVRGYYRIGKLSKAEQISRILVQNAYNEIEFYSKFPPRQQKNMEILKKRSLQTIDELYNLANYYLNNDYLPEITNLYKRASDLYMLKSY